MSVTTGDGLGGADGVGATATPRGLDLPDGATAGPVGSPYQSYVYAYPHKTAYRPLPERPTLRGLWQGEAQDALSLYAHIPFCEVRCGFCNLFTRIGAPEGMTEAYLDALDRQAVAVREALEPDARFATAAFGGGTPTFLTAVELERLCDIAELRMGASLADIPLSVESSPSTATADRMTVLADRGATRVSIGVQSFVDAEARAAVRPQRRAEVEAALGHIRDARIPTLNIDLIYGIDGQTEQSFDVSLDAALGWRPEELYLYPLYVRPGTGLGRRGPDGTGGPGSALGPSHAEGGSPHPAWDEHRLRLYRHGRDRLLAAGYRQASMRQFRRLDAPAAGEDDYACQTDGMVGLGCGARSYTSRLHYSFGYAVAMPAIRSIIDAYVTAPDFTRAEVGRWMDAGEARRRHLLQSLLQADGMDLADYRRRFGTDPREDFPAETRGFDDRGWLTTAEGGVRLRLTPEGLAQSDAIGPALFSPAVRTAMDSYEQR